LAEVKVHSCTVENKKSPDALLRAGKQVRF